MNEFNIDPNDKDHQRLQSEVMDYCESLGRRGVIVKERQRSVEEIPIHIITDASLDFRLGPDLIVAFLYEGCCFYIEIKTHKSRDQSDTCTELYQLLKNMDHECLYVYHNFWKGEGGGFWTDNLPKIKRIHIPIGMTWKEDRDEKEIEFFKNASKKIQEKVGYVIDENHSPTRGTDDPFVVFDVKPEILSPWKKLIEEKITC